MEPRDQLVGEAQLPSRLAELDGWQGSTRGIGKDYHVPYDTAIRIVADIGKAAIDLQHRPDIDIRWDRLNVFMTTHTAGDVITELDLQLARRIDSIVAAHKNTTG